MASQRVGNKVVIVNGRKGGNWDNGTTVQVVRGGGNELKRLTAAGARWSTVVPKKTQQ